MAWVGISCLLLGLGVVQVSSYSTDRWYTKDWRYQVTTESYQRTTDYPAVTGVSPSQHCDTFYQSSGSLTSKNYPNYYPNNVACEYIIDPGRSVYFKVIDSDFEPCCDHLRIFDQYGSEWNWNTTGYLYSPHITVIFHTDGSGQRRGFKLDWNPYNVPTKSPYRMDYTTDWWRYTTNRWYRDTTGPSWYGGTTDNGAKDNVPTNSPYRMDYTTDWWRYTTNRWYRETTAPSVYGGTTDNGVKDCGSYSSYDGSISSPNYPHSYPNNVNCMYTIHPGVEVWLRVVDYHLEHCCDHLRILYDIGMELNASSTDYVNVSNATIFFKTDGSVINRGFKIEWHYNSVPSLSPDRFVTYPDYRTSSRWYHGQTTDWWRYTTNRWYRETTAPSWYGGTTDNNVPYCGGFFSADGTLSSPNYPHSYPNNLNCRYTIQPDRGVYLRVVDYHLEQCCDHLRIFDDLNENEINASSTNYWWGQNFTIFFKTDSSVTNRGFRIEWNRHSPPTLSPDRFSHFANDSQTTRYWYQTTTEPNKYCDKTSYSASGVIESPNYPFSYYNNLNCHYRLLTSTTSLLKVDAMDLERGYDVLEISYLTPYGSREYVNLTGSDRGYSMLGTDWDINFTTDGSNRARGFQLSWRLASGDLTTSNWRWQTTDRWGWGTTLPWWRYTTEPRDKISVHCNAHDFTVAVPRDVIRQVFPGVSEYNLALINSNCRGQVYSDVVMFRSNILGCGMTREETRYDIVYQNRISPVNQGRYTTDSYYRYTTEAPIARFDSSDIKVECHLDNYATAIGHFKPTNNNELIARGRGNISVYMDFYRDYSYNYKITSYPISLGLNEDVFVDLRLDTDDKGLNMAVQRCIATPTYNRYTSEYHTLIRYGCPDDSTVSFEHTSGQHVHFRFRGFEFLREKSNVFIFCDVNICNSTDYGSRCHRNCNRRRRDVDSEPGADLNLFQGPLKFRDERSADHRADKAVDEKATQSMSISASVMAISAVAMVIAAVVMAMRRRKRYATLQA